MQPTFTPTAAVTPDARRDQRLAERREILDAMWRTVRDRHYDARLGGVDWDAARRRHEPIALAAPGEAAFYRALNDMLGELGQSHMMITGPGAADEDEGATAVASPPSTSGSAPAGAPVDSVPTTTAAPTAASPVGAPVAVTGVGDPGLTVRAIEGRPTVTAVRSGSSAARHRIGPGFIVTRVGGRPLSAAAAAAGKRPLRPVEERFALRREALHLLQGPAGTKVTVEYLDNDDRPGQAILDRDEPAGPVRQIGHLPPLHPEARVSEINGVGVIAFNVFLLDPLLADIKQAVDRFRTTRARAVILDLRGNP
ncbi:MAG: hypothetical protein ABUS79_28105, partial [Pseudomonadota bacterium]